MILIIEQIIQCQLIYQERQSVALLVTKHTPDIQSRKGIMEYNSRGDVEHRCCGCH